MCTYKKRKEVQKIWPAGKKVELMCLCVSDLQECKYCSFWSAGLKINFKQVIIFLKEMD